MKTIHKFRIPIPKEHRFTIELPVDAEVLHVGTQDMYGDVAWLWALVDTDKPKAKHVFELYGTGHDVHLRTGPEHDATAHRRLRHVGTFMLDQGHFVGHVFQVVNGFGGPVLE